MTDGPMQWLGIPPQPGRQVGRGPFDRRDVRIWMLTGWARWLATRASATERSQETLRRVRPRGNYGIAVEEDEHAAAFQQLDFYRARACHGAGAYGMTGRASFGEGGWTWDDDEAVRRYDREHVARKRERAHQLRHLARGLWARLDAEQRARDEDEFYQTL